MAEIHGTGIQIYRSAAKSFALFLCALAFVAYGLFLMSRDPMDWHNAYSGLFFVFGLLCVLVFGSGAAAILLHMTRRGPVIIIGEHGIWDARVSNGFIPWSEISDVRIHNLHNQKFVGLVVENPELYVAAGALRELKREMNERAGYSPIQITLTALKAKPEAVIRAICEHHDRSRSRFAQPAE